MKAVSVSALPKSAVECCCLHPGHFTVLTEFISGDVMKIYVFQIFIF